MIGFEIPDRLAGGFVEGVDATGETAGVNQIAVNQRGNIECPAIGEFPDDRESESSEGVKFLVPLSEINHASIDCRRAEDLSPGAEFSKRFSISGIYRHQTRIRAVI